jgi:PHD/YefM family antitoxin component YafN of YafNO toxin-antitoxin module
LARKALFQGLVIDAENDPVDVVEIGGEAFYVVDDDGFRRHIESETVDRQVLNELYSLIEGNEELISLGTMRMLGQEDIFTKAAIEESLRKADQQFEALLQTGLPEDMQAWLGMMGFQVRIDVHGDVLEVIQPAGPDTPEE